MTAALRLGTRGSRLALIQSNLVADLLRALGHEVELVTLVTSGDVRRPDTAWGEGAFVGALETALLAGEIDLAVHSAKDVPIEPEDDLRIAAFPARADARDVLVVREGSGARSLATLATGAVIGTDSPRRSGFVLAERPDVEIAGLSGNVDTRLAKLDRGDADALVLAVAGLARLERSDRMTELLPVDLLPPAPGQGALAVQIRADRDDIAEVVVTLDDPATRTAVQVEREVLRLSGGGCRAPLGAFAIVVGGEIRLVAGVVDPSGGGRRLVTRSGPATSGLTIAADVADELLPDRRWPAPPPRPRGADTPA